MQAGAAEPIRVLLRSCQERRRDAGNDERDHCVFTKHPFFGSRQIAAYLRREDTIVGRHRVRRLMAANRIRNIGSSRIC